MIVVPVHPMGQRKRQDDVLSFQKNHRISLPFIAYLSLLNDRPNSFYHLNFNIFFSNFSYRERERGGRTLVFNFKLYFSKPVTVLQWFAIHLTCLCVQTYAENQENYFSIRTFFLRKFYLFLKLDLVSKLNLDSI